MTAEHNISFETWLKVLELEKELKERENNNE